MITFGTDFTYRYAGLELIIKVIILVLDVLSFFSSVFFLFTRTKGSYFCHNTTSFPLSCCIFVILCNKINIDKITSE